MTVEINYESGDKLDLDHEEIIEKVCRGVLEAEGCPYEADINVLLADDEHIKELNTKFRFIESTTDVLSFPMVNFEAPSQYSILEDEMSDFFFDPISGELILGDIAISVQKVRSQAEAYGHSQERELAFLVAHSMLHLLGYDHEDDAGRELMEEKQRTILDALGITR